MVIRDAYNANPVSMSEALTSFILLDQAPKCVILGDMLELGSQAGAEHKKIIKLLSGAKEIPAYLVGSFFAEAATGTDFKTFQTTADLKSFLEANPVSGSTILVKGSRGIGLENIYDLL